MLDIQAILDNHPRLDEARVRRWVLEFAEALEMPELWQDIADWFNDPAKF